MIWLVKAVKGCRNSKHVDSALTVACIVLLESPLSPILTVAIVTSYEHGLRWLSVQCW